MTLYYIGALIAGIILLVLSADRFVAGASSTAYRFGMKPLFIGMFVVGFGTSAPEMLVSALAALDGSPAMALGNAFGSNIANIGLILGITALISPIVMGASDVRHWPLIRYISDKDSPSIVKREIPITIIIIVLTALLFLDGSLNQWKSITLLAAFVGFIIWSYLAGKKSPSVSAEKITAEYSLNRGIFWLIFGLIVLISSSQLLVWGAVGIATELGVSDMMIGLTIVAVGTSLPELASSVVAARKGEHDIAVGNVLGSNIFNSLAVIGIAGVIQPFSLDYWSVYRDLAVMLALTFVLFYVCSNMHKVNQEKSCENKWRITRKEGALLLSIYIGYTALLIWQMVD